MALSEKDIQKQRDAIQDRFSEIIDSEGARHNTRGRRTFIDLKYATVQLIDALQAEILRLKAKAKLRKK